MRRRVDRLEARAKPALARDEAEISARACERLSTEDLLALEEAYVRLNLEDDSRDEFSWEELTERERRAFERYEEAKEAVRADR